MGIFKNSTQRNFRKEMKKLEKDGKLPEGYSARFKHKRAAAVTISVGTIITAIWCFSILSSFFINIYNNITAPGEQVVITESIHQESGLSAMISSDINNLYRLHQKTTGMFASYISSEKNYTAEDIAAVRDELNLALPNIDAADSDVLKKNALLIQKNISLVLLFLQTNYDTAPTQENFEMIKSVIDETNGLFVDINDIII